MRTLIREEIPIIKYSSEKTAEPPDTTFEIAVPLVHDDNIFNIIANDLELSEDQRYS